MLVGCDRNERFLGAWLQRERCGFIGGKMLDNCCVFLFFILACSLWFLKMINFSFNVFSQSKTFPLWIIIQVSRGFQNI